MIPVRLTLEGFLSYRERQTLEFDGAPLWVLVGPNGAGKSAIFDAMTFALFDAHRLGKQRAQELINHYRDRLEVEFDFLVDGKMYRVRRTVQRRGARPTREVCRLIAQDGQSPSVEPIRGTDQDTGFKEWVARTLGLGYEAFTSSVLLLQGESEKLLRAKASERYVTLGELIDLKPYQELHGRIDKVRGHWRAQADVLKRERDAIPEVPEEQLASAREGWKKAEERYQQSQACVDSLTTTLEQAKQWTRHTTDLNEAGTKLSAARDVIGRQADILAGFHRWEALDRVLPELQSILDWRGRLGDFELQVEELEARQPELNSAQATADAQWAAARDSVEANAREATRLNKKSREIADRLAAIAPLVANLDQVEGFDARLAAYAGKLLPFPIDLAEQFSVACARERELAEAERAKPVLELLMEARGSLAKAVEDERTAATSLEAIDTEAGLLAEEKESREERLQTLHDQKESSQRQVHIAEERHREAQDRLAQFAAAADQPTCSLCGQTVSREHAAAEAGRLRASVEAAESELRNCQAAADSTATAWASEKTALTETTDRLASLAQRRHECVMRKVHSEKEIPKQEQQLNKAYRSLPLECQKRVAVPLPQNHAEWLGTTFPNEADLEATQRDAESRPQHTQRRQELENQHKAWQRLHDLRQELERQRDTLRASFAVEEAITARDERTVLLRSQADLQTQIEQRASALDEAERAATESETNAKLAHDTFDEAVRKLATVRATRDESVRNLEATIQRLPEGWRESARAIESEGLDAYRSERDTLAPYYELKTTLDQALAAVGELEERTRGLEAAIAALPEMARRSPEQIETELGIARSEREEGDEARREAEAWLTKLASQQQQREAASVRYRDAEHQRDLHARLANLLGRQGLQLTLLRRAERAIVELANETLEGLSRGRLRLELRGTQTGGPPDGEALDLIVYDRETGMKPIAAMLTSGSQRFRIAISLALAIGRYSGREARRIEAVIIDEGFGSLDSNGRDDMIHELNGLKQYLSRIILVSHQDEFASAFTNGYAVALEDGASCVRLFESA